MSILHQANLIAQAVIANGLVTGNTVQNPDNLLNTTNSTALFGATSDVIIGNFPFNLPLDAVIVGISGILKARIDNNSIPAGSITPVLVDSSSGSNEYFPGPAVTGLSDVLQEYEIGGQYDIWGNGEWTPTKINNLKLQLIANSSLEVAWASMTVFYYIPQTTPVPDPFELPGCEDCDSTIQALPFELAQPWLTGQTKLIARSFNTPAGDPITLEMLGECGGTINVTIDPDLRKEDGGNFIENFNIDADLATITFQPNGYVEIDIGDIEQRGLGFTTPYGHDSANISEHAVGAVFIITNNGPFNSKLLKRCHIGTLVSAPIEVQDEGDTVVTAVDKINFIGDNVQAEQDGSDPRKANVTVVANPTNVTPTVETTNTGTNNTTPSTTLTVPLTITDANYLRVAVITEDETITGVTYNGDAMTFIGEQVNPGVNLKVALFGLINPDAGTHDAVVTMPNARIITAIVTGWLDVNTTDPVDGISAGAIGSNNAPTDSVTTTSDNTIVQDVVGTTNNPTTFTQFGLWSIQGSVTTGIRPGSSASRRVLAPQSVTDIYSLSLSTGWAILLAGIRGIASTPDGSVTLKNNGTPVGTFSTLNLKPGLTATDAGGGEADITATGGSGGSLVEARAYKSESEQSIPADTPTKIILDGISFDTDSAFSSSTFTAPVEGYYQINASVYYLETPVSDVYSAFIYKNGSLINSNFLVSSSIAGNDVQVTTSDIVFLEAGDTIELYGIQASPIPVSVSNISAETYLSISLQTGTSPSGAGVQSVTSSDSIIDVNNTDPENPVLSLDIDALTNNETFQTNVNNFVSGGGNGLGGTQFLTIAKDEDDSGGNGDGLQFDTYRNGRRVLHDEVNERIYVGLSAEQSANASNGRKCYLRIFKNDFGNYYQENEIEIEYTQISGLSSTALLSAAWAISSTKLYAVVKASDPGGEQGGVFLIQYDLDGTNPIVSAIYSSVFDNRLEDFEWDSVPSGGGGTVATGITIDGDSLFLNYVSRPTDSDDFVNEFREYDISAFPTITLANTYAVTTGDVGEQNNGHQFAYDATEDVFLLLGEDENAEAPQVTKYEISGSNFVYVGKKTYTEISYGNNSDGILSGYVIANLVPTSTYYVIYDVQLIIQAQYGGSSNDFFNSWWLETRKYPKF